MILLQQGELIAREINQHFKNVQPNIKARVCYRAKRLGSAFNIKDQRNINITLCMKSNAVDVTQGILVKVVEG